MYINRPERGKSSSRVIQLLFPGTLETIFTPPFKMLKKYFCLQIEIPKNVFSIRQMSPDIFSISRQADRISQVNDGTWREAFFVLLPLDS